MEQTLLNERRAHWQHMVQSTRAAAHLAHHSFEVFQTQASRCFYIIQLSKLFTAEAHLAALV